MRPLPPNILRCQHYRKGAIPDSVKTHMVHRSPPGANAPQNLTRLFSDVDMRLHQGEQLVLQKRAARQKP
jgi:hypothetical protein